MRGHHNAMLFHIYICNAMLLHKLVTLQYSRSQIAWVQVGEHHLLDASRFFIILVTS